jgi:thiol:disulfide interchange protein
MARAAVAAFVVALFACHPQPRNPASSPAPLPTVLDAVRATHRPLLVFFVAPWCKACHEFESHVLSDPRVITALGDTFVVAYDIDEANGADALHRCGASWIPVLYFVDPSGRGTLIPKLPSGPDAFLAALDKLGALPSSPAPDATSR